MPSFDTPAPISVVANVTMGLIVITASDRTDTVVEVSPSDATKKSDLAAAEQTRVDFTGGRLSVKGPRGRRQYALWGRGDSIDVHICLPAASSVQAEMRLGTVRTTGALGDCQVHTGAGDIQLDQAGSAHLKTGAGDISADRIGGQAELTTGTGAVRVGAIEGDAVVKNGNGDTWIGEVGGEARVQSANGKISVDRAGQAVVARTANGDISLGEVARGAIVAHTACGKLNIGVRDGVAAWLDLHTGFGTVHNRLAAADGPGAGEDTVEVRARTAYGDITVSRRLADRTGGR